MTQPINKIEQAIGFVCDGAPIRESSVKSPDGVGRPVKVYTVEHPDYPPVELDREEYMLVIKESRKAPTAIGALQELRSMSPEEFSENARLAVPKLLNRAIQLAMVSPDVKEVMAVAKELIDRGYGKTEKTHDTTQKADFIRLGWDSMPQEAEFEDGDEDQSEAD